MSRNGSNFPLLLAAAASFTLGFLAVYLLKDKGVESKKIDCFDKLSAELKFQIFEQCDSMSDVASLIAASPSIQDLVNICTEIQELSPRACYNSSAVYAKPLLSKLWHHRFVETYLREEISTAMKYYGSRLIFPPRNNLSPELYVFLFTRNYVGSRLPDIDTHVSIGRLGARSFGEMISIAGDPLKSQGISKRRKAEIQSWRDMRRKTWKEEDKKVQNGQMVVQNGCARLLRADEFVQT
uniref:Uncharacterized protein n=1 Tax=Fusarium oxysporum (strain Fo5176) TaxID=660025 RepID=A0A0D2XNZ6_FUSOF